MEAGSVYPRREAKDPKEKQNQPVLPSTLKARLKQEPLSEGPMKPERKPAKTNLLRESLPKELQANVRRYFGSGDFYSDGWLRAGYYNDPEEDEGLVGVHTKRGGPFSHVTFAVVRGRLTQVYVNCCKSTLSKMLRNGLPKELKEAMEYARERM